MGEWKKDGEEGIECIPGSLRQERGTPPPLATPERPFRYLQYRKDTSTMLPGLPEALRNKHVKVFCSQLCPWKCTAA